MKAYGRGKEESALHNQKGTSRPCYCCTKRNGTKDNKVLKHRARQDSAAQASLCAGCSHHEDGYCGRGNVCLWELEKP